MIELGRGASACRLEKVLLGSPIVAKAAAGPWILATQQDVRQRKGLTRVGFPPDRSS